MKKWIVFGVVIIIAVITNPKKEDHVATVKREISQSVLPEAVEGLKSENGFEQAGVVLGMTLGMKVIDNMLESMLEVNNYLLFSLTKFSYADKQRIIGIGAFGNVWLFVDLKEGLSGLKE